MFEPVKNERVSDEILRQIRDAVLAGKFQIGDRLPNERALAQQFAASRTSVREALRGLEQAGVIYIKKGINGGVFIADPDHRMVSRPFQTLLQLRKVTMDNIVEARLIFEPAAARLAAQRAEAEDLEEMREVIEKMSQAVETGELPASFDLKFHKLIARAARNPILEMLSESMLEVASQVITDLHPSIDVLKHVVDRHREVFEAVRKSDGDLACSVMSQHIIDVRNRLAHRTARNNRHRKSKS
ncbi:MAG TPA: FadR/GntR family transcriptional regulator [Pyrinomonadaceae bacterium]|nr:FadR/GntR family transcriptional regulator [Pyrinomonadaceae bacterium]